MNKRNIKNFLLLSLILSPISLINMSCANTSTQEKLDKGTLDLGNDILYEGEIKNNLPYGEGTIKYKNGDKLSGSFKDGKLKEDTKCKITFKSDDTSFEGSVTLDENYNFNLIEGTHFLKNRRSYTGKFKNNKYEDKEATFDFGTNTKYVGPFVNGSNIGQIGTIYYPPHVMNGEGVHYFKGKMALLGKFEENQYGEGKIRFGDRSVYIGGLHYKKGNEYYRYGEGVQDFSECSFNASIVGGPSDELINKYVGHFDYTKTEWIYGDGVFYFTDYTLKPKSYLKGFFYALKRAGEATKTIEILDEYKNLKEVEWNPENKRKDEYVAKYQNKTPDIVFCGDSYMDMWQASFGLANYEVDTASLNAVNTGIGGTVGAEWVKLSKELITNFNPNKVFIHLGFNDLHLGFTIEETINNFKIIGQNIITKNPNAKIHFLGVEPSPAFRHFFDQEVVLNSKIAQMCDENENFVFIDTNNLFIKDGKQIPNLSNYFSNDLVHMNNEGYKLWWNKIKTYIN